MKPKTLVLCVIAVLLLAGAAWQLADRGQPEAGNAPLVAAAEPAAEPELPVPQAVVPAADDEAAMAAAAEGNPPIKRTQLPDGKILIENQPLTLRHSDGRVEQRLVRMIAKPVKMKAPLKRPMPAKQDASAAPQSAAPATPPAIVEVNAPGSGGTPGADGDAGGGAAAGEQGSTSGGSDGADKPDQPGNASGTPK